MPLPSSLLLLLSSTIAESSPLPKTTTKQSKVSEPSNDASQLASSQFALALLYLFLYLSLIVSRISNINLYCQFMSEKGQPLPKFGEWDVNDLASAEGFTVIFNKARDEKKTGGKPESPESRF
ncbi:Protein NOI4 [Camellia lanceoleosa]|uniref:Protein NOI4 n=1 Tax=Camellia lanceoleosa TaxID=1840588 RepID=A0ACC0HQ13_9ERIC|nr:Protein NOI4 [Camellia lanceoleosa]